MASPLHRSLLNHDCCLTLLCGTIDPRSSLHSLCGDVRILLMILDLVLPEWRRQAEKVDLFAAAKKGQMPELREKLHLTDVDVNAEDLFGSTALIQAACCSAGVKQTGLGRTVAPLSTMLLGTGIPRPPAAAAVWRDPRGIWEAASLPRWPLLSASHHLARTPTLEAAHDCPEPQR